MFWADYSGGKVLRGTLRGDMRNETIHQSDSSIFDVKVYMTGRVCKHLYFTIPLRGVIARTNCQGQDYTEIVQFSDIAPHGLHIQISLDELFFTDGGGVIGHIDHLDQCSLDACNVTILQNRTADEHEFLFCSGSAPHRKLFISDHKGGVVSGGVWRGGGGLGGGAGGGGGSRRGLGVTAGAPIP